MSISVAVLLLPLPVAVTKLCSISAMLGWVQDETNARLKTGSLLWLSTSIPQWTTFLSCFQLCVHVCTGSWPSDCHCHSWALWHCFQGEGHGRQPVYSLGNDFSWQQKIFSLIITMYFSPRFAIFWLVSCSWTLSSSSVYPRSTLPLLWSHSLLRCSWDILWQKQEVDH